MARFHLAAPRPRLNSLSNHASLLHCRSWVQSRDKGRLAMEVVPLSKDVPGAWREGQEICGPRGAGFEGLFNLMPTEGLLVSDTKRGSLCRARRCDAIPGQRRCYATQSNAMQAKGCSSMAGNFPRRAFQSILFRAMRGGGVQAASGAKCVATSLALRAQRTSLVAHIQHCGSLSNPVAQPFRYTSPQKWACSCSARRGVINLGKVTG